MKKILLLSVLICLISGKLFAQNSSAGTSEGGKFSIGIDAGLPVGTSHDVYSFAIGGDIKYASQVAPDFAVSISGGYTELIGKTFSYNYSDANSSVSFGGTTSNIGVIPVKVGGRYTANGTTGFFIEGQVGAAFITQHVGTAFIYAPGIGYSFAGGFEAGARYEGWVKDGTIGQVALRLAYSF